MSETSAVLQLRQVRKSYPGAVSTEVLHGIDIRVDRGEFVALVGPSGSGKSTLLNILGLLDRPTSGTVEILGQDCTGLDDAGLTKLRGRSLGFVFQFHHLLPAFTAEENVYLPMLANVGHFEPEMRERARELLARIGLEGFENRMAGQLSGGQQQRVAIVRALVMNPALVLADEPTGNLDQASGSQAFELMRRFNRESKTAFLLVTHELALAQRCDRIIRLVDGSIAGGETSGEALKKEPPTPAD
jgi:lipoprotein-releasing system ATP-binding protein